MPDPDETIVFCLASQTNATIGLLSCDKTIHKNLCSWTPLYSASVPVLQATSMGVFSVFL